MHERRPLRAAISLVLLLGLVWFTCTVKLGPRTLAEHVDVIGQTPEARALLDGARTRLNPLLDEATERVLGETVEAPTRAAATRPRRPPNPSRARARTEDRGERTPAPIMSEQGVVQVASTAARSRVPGQPPTRP